MPKFHHKKKNRERKGKTDSDIKSQKKIFGAVWSISIFIHIFVCMYILLY